MSSYKELVIASGPVSYWRMDSTTEAKDSVDSNTGVLNGSIPTEAGALEPGDTNKANAFTKEIANFWGIPDAANLKILKKLTVSAFLYPTEATSKCGIIDHTSAGATNTSWQLMIEGGKGRLSLKPAGALKGVLTTATLGLNEYSQVVATFDVELTEKNMKIFTNGAESGTAVTNTEENTSTSGETFIGKLGSGVFPMVGRIDEVVVWNRALTGAEIKTLYEAKANAPTETTATETNVVLGDRPRIRLATTNIG